eukprot:6478719-Alexandrium_andersonii.AAC.1
MAFLNICSLLKAILHRQIMDYTILKGVGSWGSQKRGPRALRSTRWETISSSLRLAPWRGQGSVQGLG